MEEELNILDEEIEVFIRCYNQSEDSIRKYHIYGPANPIVNDCRDDSEYEFCPYSEDGVCYMLTCRCKELDQGVEKKTDYYVGYCLECKVELLTKADVWRTPVVGGGFIGCYCREHFRLNVKRPEDSDEYDAHSSLCDIMICIRDRHPVYSLPSVDETIENIYDEEL